VARRRPSGSESIAAGLDGFEPLSVIRGAAALALWPANSDRHVALNGLVDELSTRPLAPARGKPPIDAAHWRRWLAGRSSKRLRRTQPDGIHDEPLCVQAALLGRRCALLAGDLEFPGVHYRLWYGALDSLLAEAPDPALRGALDLLENVARLSDRVVSDAELGGYRWPDHSLERKLGVSNDAEYRRLCEALTIPAHELAGDLEVDRAVVDPLVRSGRTREHSRPLVAGPDGELLVADPWRLTLAALVRSYALAAASPRWPLVLERLGAAALEIAAEAATDMDWQVEQRDEASLLARADVDCRLLIAVCVLPPSVQDTDDPQLDAPPLLGECYQRVSARARALGVQHALIALVGDGRGITVPAEHPCMHAADATSPWLLGVGELQLLGDALRRDQLALPVALERSPRPPWPENVDLVDYVGVVRRVEEPLPAQSGLPEDGTEHLRLRARMMAARHPAPGPEGGDFIEVSRWGGSPDAKLFCARGLQGFSLLVRSRGRSVWVTCEDRQAGRHDLPGVICTMLSHWLARLCERDWPRVPAPLDVIEMVMRFRLDVSEEPGPALGVCEADGHGRVMVGPGFVNTMCRGDNSADRMLIGAVLAWADDRTAEEQLQLLDEVARPGRGTFVIWPKPELRSNPPRVPMPPLVAPRDRRAVEQEVAGTLVPPDQIVVVNDERAAPALRDLLEVLEVRVRARVSALSAGALLALVALHERALFQSTVEGLGLPARDALEGSEEHLGPREAVDGRNVAIRALIERLAAAPPAGSRELGEREAGWLRAATELELTLGSAHDALGSGHARGRVVVGPRVGVLVALEGLLPTAGGRMAEQFEQAAPDLMAREHADWWTDQPREREPVILDRPIDLDDRDWQRLDRALVDEAHVGLEQLLRVLRALCELAEQQPGAVMACTPRKLTASLSAITGIEQPTVEAAIGRLTLGPYPGYDARAAPHRPWRPNRERSYLRRPLVQLADGRLAWSSLHALSGGRYLIGLIEGGRLRGQSAVSKAVGKISQGIDRQFETVLLEAVTNLGWQARPRVKRLGGVWLERAPGEPIGDIDVLAFAPQRRQVWLLDAKRLAPGLESYAMVRDGETVARLAGHHLERLQWVRRHRTQLTDTLGQDVSGWTVRAALVVDRPLAGAHMRRLGLAVWTFWELPGKLKR
jgi:hypothetical protein